MTGEELDQSASTDPQPAPEPQRIEIIGVASPEQVAALVAVLSGLGGGEGEPAGRRTQWTSRERLVQRATQSTRGGWRASALPRSAR